MKLGKLFVGGGVFVAAVCLLLWAAGFVRSRLGSLDGERREAIWGGFLTQTLKRTGVEDRDELSASFSDCRSGSNHILCEGYVTDMHGYAFGTATVEFGFPAQNSEPMQSVVTYRFEPGMVTELEATKSDLGRELRRLESGTSISIEVLGGSGKGSIASDGSVNLQYDFDYIRVPVEWENRNKGDLFAAHVRQIPKLKKILEKEVFEGEPIRIETHLKSSQSEGIDGLYVAEFLSDGRRFSVSVNEHETIRLNHILFFRWQSQIPAYHVEVHPIHDNKLFGYSDTVGMTDLWRKQRLAGVSAMITSPAYTSHRFSGGDVTFRDGAVVLSIEKSRLR